MWIWLEPKGGSPESFSIRAARMACMSGSQFIELMRSARYKYEQCNMYTLKLGGIHAIPHLTQGWSVCRCFKAGQQK